MGAQAAIPFLGLPARRAPFTAAALEAQARLAQLASGTWYFSSETTAGIAGADRFDVELTGIGLVRKPAQISIEPVVLLADEITPVDVDRWHHLPRCVRDRLRRAIDQARSNDRELTIIDRLPPSDLRRLEGRSLDSLSRAQRLALAEDQIWERKTAQLPASQWRWRPGVVTSVR